MTNSKVDNFYRSTVEEEIFLFVNYIQSNFQQSAYIKICFSEKSPTDLLKKKISDAMPGVNVMNCHFMWNNVILEEDDLIPLIKAKAGCGHFQLNLKDKPEVEKSDDAETITELEAKRCPFPLITHCTSREEPNVDTITDTVSENLSVITSAKFTAFINESESTKYLLHCDHTEPLIRRFIISCACDFLTKECGDNASLNDKNKMVKVVVDVFHGLEQQEQFVTKWLNMKIRNNRRKKKLDDESNDCTFKKCRIEADDHLNFLKTLQGPLDIPKIKSALKATLNFRLEQYTRENFSVFDAYNFFMKNPDLIYYEFDIRFPNAADDFPSNLELFLDAAYNIFRAETNLPVPAEDCLPCIQKLLCICHYTKTSSRPPASLSEMLDSIVIFLTEDQDKKPKFKQHPILLAQGPLKNIIDKYFLQVKDVLVELPSEISFLQAFDYLLRSYYVFNVTFPQNLLVFFNFLMINVYDVRDPKNSQIEEMFSKQKYFLQNVLKFIDDMK